MVTAQNPKPSWYGESVGHYEGDTLVIDTIGQKQHRMSVVDPFGTPHTDKIHVVERYRTYRDPLGKGLEIVQDIAPGLEQVWADPRAIRQICLNLMSNALKFTPRGGQIFVTVEHTGAGGQRLSVRDTGSGIPKAEIPKVLQAFGQGSLAHQTAEGGTGLGLPIVKNLIELHGGRFELHSERRKGTEAVVYMPAKRLLLNLGPLQPFGHERHREEVSTRRPRMIVAAEPRRATRPARYA